MDKSFAVPFEVVLRPHVWRFVKSYYPHKNVISIQRNSFPGYIMIPLLEKNVGYNENTFAEAKGKVFKFLISEFLFEYYGAGLTKNTVYCINEQLDNVFREQLFKACDLVRSVYGEKVEIKKAIMEFCAGHGIAEDDISYETLKKDYYRWRKMYGRRSKIFS